MREHGKRYFTEEVESAAHLRQGGKCALCGVSLVWGHDKALPVVPIERQSTATSDWKKGVDNCVILCNGCWTWALVDDAHAGTSLHLPEEYKFSHGVAKNGGHREWATRMMGR